MLTRAGLVVALFTVTACTQESAVPDPTPGGGGKADDTTESVEIEVKATARVAKLVAPIACVERFNSEGESTGPSIWFHLSVYHQVLALELDGLTTRTLTDGDTCIADGGTLPYAAVDEYARASELDDAIQDAGGYKEALVLFWNAEALQEALRVSTTAALESVE